MCIVHVVDAIYVHAETHGNRHTSSKGLEQIHGTTTCNMSQDNLFMQTNDHGMHQILKVVNSKVDQWSLSTRLKGKLYLLCSGMPIILKIMLA